MSLHEPSNHGFILIPVFKNVDLLGKMNSKFMVGDYYAYQCSSCVLLQNCKENSDQDCNVPNECNCFGSIINCVQPHLSYNKHMTVNMCVFKSTGGGRQGE